MEQIGNKKSARGVGAKKQTMQEPKTYQGWTILVDCDGCLTDGKKYVDELGNRQLIAFHSRDSIACKMLVEIGFQVFIVTASTFSGINDYWKRHGAQTITAWGVDKITALEKRNLGIDWTKTIGIGDDITDLCYLEKCEIAICPKDAHLEVEKHPKTLVSKSKGGKALLAELYTAITKANLIEEYAN